MQFQGMAGTQTRTRAGPPPGDLPTERELTTHLLHHRHGLTDGAIAGLLGLRRESVNRSRSSYRRKADAIRLRFLEVGGSILEALAEEAAPDVDVLAGGRGGRFA